MCNSCGERKSRCLGVSVYGSLNVQELQMPGVGACRGCVLQVLWRCEFSGVRQLSIKEGRRRWQEKEILGKMKRLEGSVKQLWRQRSSRGKPNLR